MLLLVFLPQKIQRYSTAFLQLGMDLGEVRNQAGVARWSWGWKKDALKETVALVIRQWPGYISHPGSFQIITHCTAAHISTTGYFTIAATKLILESQYLSDLSHRQPLFTGGVKMQKKCRFQNAVL
jgi:hypothetical protein